MAELLRREPVDGAAMDSDLEAGVASPECSSAGAIVWRRLAWTAAVEVVELEEEEEEEVLPVAAAAAAGVELFDDEGVASDK